MSDPASGSENDAVLASIRRLVLTRQDDRDALRDDTPPGPLVLTAALRVDMGDHRSDIPKVADALDWQDELGRDATGSQATGSQTAESQAAGSLAMEYADDAPRDLPDGHAGSDLAEAVVDEDFLRDIVSEIVREELQGDLGERITRNVRKLVRREIHRALTSRDFD